MTSNGMPRPKKDAKKIKQIWIIINLTKIIWAAIIFYLWLSINVKDTWENILDWLQKDFFNITEESNVSNSWQEIHFAATDEDKRYLEKFEETCLSNTQLCDKIIFYGTYKNKEKYWYTKENFDVIGFIEDWAIIWWNFEWKINEIKINKNSWDRRWYATREDIIINLWSVKDLTEFHDLITHELWHIFDLWYIKGKNKKMHWSFTEFWRSVFSTDDISLNFYKISRTSEKIRIKSSSQKDFCSGYWMYDPFEDFAECFNLYLNHNLLFKSMAQKSPNLKSKFNFIASIFDGEYIKSSDIEKSLISKNSSRRPRDTTKISLN